MNSRLLCHAAALLTTIFLAIQLSAPVAAETDTPDGIGPTANFGPPVTINDAAIGAHAIISADLDRDGDLDVISAARDDGKIVWYRNGGGVQPALEPIQIDLMAGAYALYAADFNGDGAIDLAAAAVGEVRPSSADAPAASGKIVWYESNRASTPLFTRHEIVGTLDYPVMVVGADMDRDGDIDLLSASRDDSLAIWYENSGAPLPTFTPHLLTDLYSGVVALSPGDLDGDGDMDVALAAEDVDVIAWLENDGGSLPQFSVHLIRTAGAGYNPLYDYAKTVYISDIDSDGDNDIAYGSEEANEIGWYVNDGAADPQFSQRILSTEVYHTKFVTTADIDQDGDQDLISASTGDHRVLIFENDGAIVPTFTSRILMSGLMGARSVAVADLNSDGLLDILTASRDDNRLLWFPNQSIHRSARLTAQSRRLIEVRDRMRHLVAGDLNNDGHQDIVSISDNDVLWHVNDGGAPPLFQTRILDNDIRQGRWVDLADLDGDGDLDVVASSTNDNAIFWFENRDGAFAKQLVAANVSGVRAALAADIDRDGDLDIYSASHGDNRIAWFENQGGSPLAFAPHTVTTDAAYARSVYAADLDNDGDLDLISASQADDHVRWYQNTGTTPPQFVPFVIDTVDGVQHVHAADIDGDGDMDILFAAEFAATFAWLENQGGAQPQFVRHTIDGNAPAAHSVTAADLDQDGDMDVIGAVEGSHSFVWYANDGARPSGFSSRLIYDKALVAHGINVADIDGDGDSDILGASRQDGAAVWFENLGGQYALDVQTTPSTQLIPGQWQPLITARATHLGRAGDADLELAVFELSFTDVDGHRLTTEEVNQRIARLGIYRDACCDAVFDAGVDKPVVLLDQLILTDDNRLVVTFPATNGAEERVANGEAATFFVSAVLNGVCGDETRPFAATLLVTSRTARDNRHKTALLAESMRTLAGGAASPDVTQSRLLINELMADNVTILRDPDEPNEYPDWIELYNDSPVAADLGGMYLSDLPTYPTQYRIPDGVSIPPYGYLVFIADGDVAQGPLHTNFRLDRSGESVGLFDRDENKNAAIDVVAFGAQEPDISYGRLPNGGARWSRLALPSPAGWNATVRLEPSVYLPLVSTAGGCR